MRIHPMVLLVAVLSMALGSAARTQQETFAHLALRVSTTRVGAVVVDRGTRDRIEKGDRVLLFPRGGGTYRGSVIQVDSRSAVVELDERSFIAEAGTRGEVLIPRVRVQPPAQPVPVDPTPPPEPASREHAGWEPRADGWEQGMPLLAKVRPVRPSERGTRLNGRIWSLADLTRVPEDRQGNRTANSAARFGTNFRVENPFGGGGAVTFDGELAWRTPYGEDDQEAALLLREFSYEHGGTRFAPSRWEVGRFLQHGMPEFGILDGLEWSHRLEGGSRFGASAGYLPNPFDDLSTGNDLQLAAFYHWSSDDLGRLTFDAGYQKTFHHADEDRDLFVFKGRYIAAEGWDVVGSTWIDYYKGGDGAKGDGPEITQAFASLRRLLDQGAGWELTYRRYSFPLTLRGDFDPITLQSLLDNHSDRLSLGGYTGYPGSNRLHGEVFGWADQSESGGGAELGFGVRDFLVDDGELDVTAFGSMAKFESLVGARVSLGRNTASGRWDLLYEIADHRLDDRDAASDDLLQHRLRASHSWYAGTGWSWSLHGEAMLWDQDLVLNAGFHVQRTF